MRRLTDMTRLVRPTFAHGTLNFASSAKAKLTVGTAHFGEIIVTTQINTVPPRTSMVYTANTWMLLDFSAELTSAGNSLAV